MQLLFTAGFRPFFLAAAAWSVLSMLAWLPLLSGDIELPTRFDPVSWHIHEMLFGFVMAAIGGFLLTAIANWTDRTPVAGIPLVVLAGLWLAGRIVCSVSAWLPEWLAPAIDLAFPLALAGIAARELIVARNRRNYPLLAPLILLAVANLLMHLQALDIALPNDIGWRLAITVVIVLISVIGGRIVPAFTRNWLSRRGVVPPPPTDWVDRVALGTLHAGMVAWTFVPDWAPIGGLLLIASLLHLLRLARWRGSSTLEEPLLLILHIGYFWLVVGTALLGLALLSNAIPTAAAVHALTAGAMGTMILAVMTRATLGHTGRALEAGMSTNVMYGVATVAAVLRVAAAWAGEDQLDLLEVASLAWVGAYALFLAEYGPMLLAPRR